MPHDNEPKGLFGAISLLTGEVGQRVRAIMERGMVANHRRHDPNHASKLISFTSYAGIEDGPLSLVRSKNSKWWPGWMIASDSSPVEASLGEHTDWYSSNRVLLSTVVALGLDAQGVKTSGEQVEQQGSVDPDWSASSLRESGVGEQGSGQIFLVLPGNGILYRHEGAATLPANESIGFCHAMEEMLRHNLTWSPDETLWKTYTRLLEDWKPKSKLSTPTPARPKIMFGHQEDVWEYFERDEHGRTRGFLHACPQCRQIIKGGALIYEAPDDVSLLSAPETYFDCPNCDEQTRLMDACGLTYLYRPDQSNLHVMNSFSVFVEHLLLYSWCAHFSKQMGKNTHEEQYNSPDASPIFIIDGPLALYGSCGRFTHAFRQKVQEAVGGGATIFGIVKTGRVRDFLDSLPDGLRGSKASYLIIPDRVRYEMIEVNNKIPGHYGFGEWSYYGHDVIVRTRRGLRFVLSVATPEVASHWWKASEVQDSLDNKTKVIEIALTVPLQTPNRFNHKSHGSFPSQEEWLNHAKKFFSRRIPTAPLWRVISTLEHVESLMFQQSSIPQVFAHMLAGTQATLIRSFLRTLTTPEPSGANAKPQNQPPPDAPRGPPSPGM